MRPLAEIIEKYEITDLSAFLDNFADADHFAQWIAGSDILDLKVLQKKFEEAEMYEYCRIVHHTIDAVVDEMLGGFGIDTE